MPTGAASRFVFSCGFEICRHHFGSFAADRFDEDRLIRCGMRLGGVYQFQLNAG